MDRYQQHKGIDQRAVRLSSQLTFPLLCRIFTPLSEQAKASGESSISVAAKLNELQLGASQAAWAIANELCEIICHKASRPASLLHSVQ